MLRNLERVGRLQVILHRVQVATVKVHVSNIVLHIDLLFANIKRHETVRRCKSLAEDYPAHDRHVNPRKRTCLGVRSQKFGKRTERNAEIAVAGLRKARPAAQNEIRVVAEETA